MNPFKVLIVDDEVNIVKGLELLVERYLPECQIVGLAYDGEEGIRQALAKEPDIILTDIRMPQVDGIELIRRLKETGSEARFIILSGFADFEYAKSAIDLGVENYLLKPVEEEALCTGIRKLCAVLDVQNKQKKQIREYGLKEILENAGDKPNEIRSKLAALDFPMKEERYLCVVLECTGNKPELILPDLQTEITDVFSFCKTVFSVLFSKSMVVWILGYKKEQEGEISKGILQIKKQLSIYKNREINVGIGVSNSRPEGIGISFEEARCALNYKVIKHGGGVIRYKEIQNLQNNQTMVDVQDVKQLEDYMEAMDEEGCRQTVDLIFKKIQEAGDISLMDLQILSLNLVLSGIRKLPFMQFQLNSYLGRNILSLESISRFQTMEQLKNWIVNMLKSMNELMLKENLPERRDIVEEIKEYINRNYNKEINLNDIADQFYINPVYLSQLFKKRTGETYQKYLTGIRMKRACKLLGETELKLYEIAELIGYSDPNYFSRMFVRFYGMKPNEYRVSQGEEKGYE
ncbi:response regulator [Lachnospiraceae bacterium OttesenSCG-928-D06]|nr:response regulator [Lachnospiraceae bacterium OttesenSCG-928-D06]